MFGMAFSDLFISVSFSNCERRCCFSFAHAAQASMARFYFHDVSFLCRKAQRKNYPSNPLQAKASQRQRECLHDHKWENSMVKHTWTVLKQYLQLWRVARLLLATTMLLNVFQLIFN